MSELVLSLFPGLDVLGQGFEDEGYCVVRGPDVLLGTDVRAFHPPPGRFDGVIGGPPCQSFSALANLVRAKGLEPKFGDLIPDFSRVVEESGAAWFLMENVPKAPDPTPEGYHVHSFILKNEWLGEAQKRTRRFWFGYQKEEADLRRWIPGAALELAETAPACVAGHDDGPWTREALRSSGKVKRTAVCGNDGRVPDDRRRIKAAPVTGRHDGAVGSPDKSYEPPRRTLADMLELQGLPPDLLDHAPFTMQAKRKLVGNAVPLPMARAIAGAVRKATQHG